MSMMRGTGPFGSRPAGVFNVELTGPERVLYFEDSPRRVRVRFAGETIADSRRVKLLHETGLAPVYYFQLNDVREDLLEPSGLLTHCPLKGDARYWSVRVGDRVATDAVWNYPDPIPGAPPLEHYAAFMWHAMDQWLEEDEEIFVHPRDPYQRVDVLASSRRVRVSAAGLTLAETTRPLLLFETSLPTRTYLSREDVRLDLLEPSDTRTRCPYKGEARYWSVPALGDAGRDLVWSYEKPLPEVARIAGRLCFYDERVDVDLDGRRQIPPPPPRRR